MKFFACLVLTVGVAACSSHATGLADGGGSGGGGAGSGGGDGGGGSGDGGGGMGATNPPPDGKFPIEHIIVVVKENHTFDNYFGSFPGAEGTQMAQTSTGIVAVGRPPVQMTRDLCHEHQCALDDWNDGAMDDWDLGDTKNQTDQLAFAQYHEDDIPNYWQYARHFALADHFFATMLGPTLPGPHVRARRAGRLGDRQPQLERDHAAHHLGLRRSAGLDPGRARPGELHRQERAAVLRHPHGRRRAAAGGDLEVLRLHASAGHRRDLVDVRRRQPHPHGPTPGRTTSSTPRRSTATSTPARCRRSCFSSTRTSTTSTRPSTSARARTGRSATSTT